MKLIKAAFVIINILAMWWFLHLLINHSTEEARANRDVSGINDLSYDKPNRIVQGESESDAISPVDHVRVLCWIMTCPRNLDPRAKNVRETWGKRCDVLLFMSSETDINFPSVGLNVTEGRDNLPEKTVQAFKYVYDHHYNDADWFLKADDDTYVIMENLRYLLHDKSTHDPIYIGDVTLAKPGVHTVYPSGGAGYILSKEALRRFGTNTNSSLCESLSIFEDMEMGRCLHNLGVSVGSNRDRHGRTGHFYRGKHEMFLSENAGDWIVQHATGNDKQRSIIDYPISYHYIEPEEMYTMEQYIYHSHLLDVLYM